MTALRYLAFFLTQVPLVLFMGAKFDLIFGFNRMDAGFAVLLFLLLLVPLLNLCWLIAEIIRFVRSSRRQGRVTTFVWPFVAALFLFESVLIDLYVAFHARM